MTFDCQSCGACCVGNLDAKSYVHLFDVDVARLPAEWRGRLVPLRPIAGAAPFALATHDSAGLDVCVALRGVVGDRVSCSIYEARPDACRGFEPGARGCLEARCEAGLAERCKDPDCRAAMADDTCGECGWSRFDPGDEAELARADQRHLEREER